MSDESSLQIQEGSMIEDFIRIIDTDNVKVNYFVAAARYLQVHWNSGNGKSSFRLKYKTGIGMTLLYHISFTQLDIAQLVASPLAAPLVQGKTLAWLHTLVKIDHVICSVVKTISSKKG